MILVVVSTVHVAEQNSFFTVTFQSRQIFFSLIDLDEFGTLFLFLCSLSVFDLLDFFSGKKSREVNKVSALPSRNFIPSQTRKRGMFSFSNVKGLFFQEWLRKSRAAREKHNGHRFLVRRALFSCRNRNVLFLQDLALKIRRNVISRSEDGRNNLLFSWAKLCFANSSKETGKEDGCYISKDYVDLLH